MRAPRDSNDARWCLASLIFLALVRVGLEKQEKNFLA